MVRYSLRRMVEAVPLLAALTLLSFALLHLTPGDPAVLLYGTDLSPSELQDIRSAWGLDQPLHIQYAKWLLNLAQGNLGYSYVDGRPVLEVIAERMPATLLLTGTGLILALLIGLGIGTLAALRPGSRLDIAATFLATLLYSIPGFWLGLLLILLFSLTLGWLPSGGMESHRSASPLMDLPRHLVLPAFVISMREAGRLLRYTRAGLLDVMRQDYTRTARAKGLSESQVVLQHAWRNALIPVITLTGLSLPYLFSSSIVVETVFSWPGVGRLAFEAALQRNYSVLMGDVLIVGILVIIGNLMADLGYALVDPRVKEAVAR